MRTDEPLSEEDAVAWAEKLYAELVAFQERSGHAIEAAPVRAAGARMGALMWTMGV